MSFALLMLLATSAADAGSTALAEIPEPHRAAVAAWVRDHEGYRLPATSECQCDEDIAAIRSGSAGPWEPKPGYQPFVAVGHFGGNNAEDVAFVVVPTRPGETIAVVVLLGSATNTPKSAQVFKRSGSSASFKGLFVRPMPTRSKRTKDRLLFGAFESEAEEIHIRPRP